MGHNETLLRLVRGPRVLLAKAQPDLVLGLLETMMQVGSQFYGHRDCGVWAKMGRPTWCPPCAHILCTRPVSPHPHCVPMPYAHFHVPHLPHVPHLLPLLGFMPRASCPMLTIMPLCPPHAHCHSPMPILCPVPPMPTLCITPYDNTCPSPMLMSHTQCPSLPRAYTSHTPVSNLCPALPMPIFVPTPGASASCPLFPFPLRPSIVKSIAPRAHLVCPLSSVRVPLPTPVPGHSAPRRQRPRCRALTREEAARVEELAGALSLQFVGPRSVRGERAAPVHTALAQALGEDALGRHPEQHSALQVGQQAPQDAGAGRRLRETNLRDARRRPQQELGGSGGCARTQAAALGRARCGFAHQLRAIEESHVQPKICGKGRGRAPGVGGAGSPSPHNRAGNPEVTRPPPREFLTLPPDK